MIVSEVRNGVAIVRHRCSVAHPLVIGPPDPAGRAVVIIGFADRGSLGSHGKSRRQINVMTGLAAVSGEEALELLKTERYDVLVTDFQMGGLNGLELIREAQKLHPDITSLLISGHSRAMLEQNRDISGVELLGKPVEVSDLRAAVQRVWHSTANLSD